MVARPFQLKNDRQMKSFKNALSLVLLFFVFCPTITKADTKNLYLSVGDEETITLPYDFTSNNGTGRWSNHDPAALDVSGSSYSVRIKVLKWVYHTCLVEYDYYYNKDGFSHHITYSIFINIKKPSLYLNVSPSGGKVKKGQKVELSCNNHNAKIYYTLNGSNPSTSSSEYSSYYGITIERSCTLKAFATWGGADSEMISEKYTVDDDPNPDPTPTPTPGSSIEINATNFPDECFRHYLLGQDYGWDGYLTNNEINNITELKNIVYEDGIRSLKGIEFFTALQTLYLAWQSIGSLDISNNTKLTSLTCIHCGLSSLDVSLNTALVTLDCSANGGLTSLKVSPNSSLKKLYCQGTKIKGSEMDELINSLPLRSSNDGKFYAVYDEDFDNVRVTEKQVDAANARGWTVYCEDANYNWKEYPGTNINGVLKDINSNSPIYNLNGQRLDKPRKGINIIGGKKKLIK